MWSFLGVSVAIQAESQANPTFNRLPSLSGQLGLGFGRVLLGLTVLAVLWAGYLLTAQPIMLQINGQPHRLRTHHRTVEAVLNQMGLYLEPEDIVQPAPDSTLSPGQTVTIQLARPVTVEADGQTWQLNTHHTQIRQVFAALGISLDARDEIQVNDRSMSLGANLPATVTEVGDRPANPLIAATPRGAIATRRPARVKLVVHRALPVTLTDGRAEQSFRTTKLTVGEALLEQGVTVYLADKITPSLNTRLQAGTAIKIERATPIVLLVDGQTIKTRTHGQTVSEILTMENIALMGQDYSRPNPNYVVSPNDIIEVVRVQETLEIEAEYIPFETEWVADAEMELDQQEVRQQGVTGVIKSRTRVHYENGQVTWREFEDEWLDQAPTNRLIAYGTEVVVRSLETPDGPIQYWRRIPMLATAYTAATSGKALDHPRYGVTRSGLEAGYGIVAVDPKVVPFMSEVYVPGYGLGIAGDTGGSVLGKHIDLGFDENKPLPSIYEWRDVYLLTPVPSANRIRYVLPQWPQRE
jgi:uncharacterized protein YabE (DUF348 family)